MRWRPGSTNASSEQKPILVQFRGNTALSRCNASQEDGPLPVYCKLREVLFSEAAAGACNAAGLSITAVEKRDEVRPKAHSRICVCAQTRRLSQLHCSAPAHTPPRVAPRAGELFVRRQLRISNGGLRRDAEEHLLPGATRRHPQQPPILFCHRCRVHPGADHRRL